MKPKIIIIILLATLLGCHKDHKIVTLNGKLTDCPEHTTCTFAYYDNAELSPPFHVKSGSDRVFLYKTENGGGCSVSTTVLFKTDLSNDDFVIDSAQIVADKVFNYNLSCICCDIGVFAQPTGGEIKGQKIDANHWLINASVKFGNSFNSATDTLNVNQYFTLTKVP